MAGASIREIASAILAHDDSQIEYYEQIVKNMPGRVLSAHGVVRRVGDSFELTEDSCPASAETAEADRLCRESIGAFMRERGDTIWEHRRPGLGVIPGSVRYSTLKRAAFRCELCGISADERALDVDHIIPRKHGGTDDSDNLQALCWQCNGNKGAGDDADFRRVRESYNLREPQCPFFAIDSSRIVSDNPLAFLIRDGFPVTEGHLLAVPKRHTADYFDLTQPERNAVQRLLEEGRRDVIRADKAVVGFNVGINAGAEAGQTIMHAHIHLIPRRAGDVEDPRGGVRGVIVAKQR